MCKDIVDVMRFHIRGVLSSCDGEDVYPMEAGVLQLMNSNCESSD